MICIIPTKHQHVDCHFEHVNVYSTMRIQLKNYKNQHDESMCFIGVISCYTSYSGVLMNWTDTFPHLSTPYSHIDQRVIWGGCDSKGRAGRPSYLGWRFEFPAHHVKVSLVKTLNLKLFLMGRQVRYMAVLSASVCVCVNV